MQVDGVTYDISGSNVSYNLGQPKREAIVGPDGVHGYKEMPQVPFVEGDFTDRGSLDLAALTNIVDGTVSLQLANGKVIMLRNAWYAGEGTGNSEAGNIVFRFEGLSAEEIS